MLRKLLTAFTNLLPARLIIDDATGTPYMIRFYLFTIAGWRCYIHEFLASDPDRGIHNHPWLKAWSFILLGWYFEELRGPSQQTGMTNKGRRVRKVRWFNTLVADTTHRVILPSEDTVFTLFAHTVGDVQEWGFFNRIEPGEHIVVEAADKDDDWIFDSRATQAVETFTPFQYPGGKKNPKWWKGAPRGKTLRENLATRFA